MNLNWQQFLSSQQAHIENNIVLDFSHPAQEMAAADKDIMCDLSQYGLIRVSGNDAASFMQGQFSNDVNKVDANTSQLNSYSNPKGRALACFRLFRHGDGYLLRLPKEILDPTLKRLRMFVLRADVTLEDVSETIVRVGLAGPSAEALLSQHLAVAPAAINQCISDKAITLIRVPGNTPRFELYGDTQQMQAFWRTLQDQVTACGEAVWRLQEIRAGLPEVFLPTREGFVPQMLNLDKLGGISFEKGCYTGQEIVARMHYLGKLKKRMFLASANTEHAPEIGAKLYSQQGSDEQGIGEIINVQRINDHEYLLLAVIQIQTAEQEAVCLDNSQGPVLTLLKLPYPISET